MSFQICLYLSQCKAIPKPISVIISNNRYFIRAQNTGMVLCDMNHIDTHINETKNLFGASI